MNILVPNEQHCKMVRLPYPILTNTQLDLLTNIRYKGFKTEKLKMLFDVNEGAEGLKKSIEHLCLEAEKSVDNGVNYIVLTRPRH